MICKTIIQKVDLKNKNNFYFSGICGAGMSALAFALQNLKKKVSGSDVMIDFGKVSPVLMNLKKKRIKLNSQDGSGLSKDVDYLVVSSAIEPDNPDVRKAKELGIPIVHRTDLLLALIEDKFQIAIAGSSGKTTTSALAAHLLNTAKVDPSYFVGGLIKGYKEHEAVYYDQESKSIVIETDESDRTIKKYTPNIGVVLSLCKDHYGIKELEKVFYNFALQCREKVIINNDDPRLHKQVKRLGKRKTAPKVITFGIKNRSDFQAKKIKSIGASSEFLVGSEKYKINLPGLHNIYNSLSVIAIGKVLGLKSSVIKKALNSFKGVRRRFELVASINGVTVIDDFAHNPDKIKATILAAKAISKRLILIYQPHGFYPTLINRNNLLRVWKENLRKNDILILPDIYIAGGKLEACKDKISSDKLINNLKKHKVKAHYIIDREEIIDFVKNNVRSKDIVIVMGARDPSLSYFAEKVAQELKK
ncbi:MAG: Mur ligase family protein [Armatimonadota bacterium]